MNFRKEVRSQSFFINISVAGVFIIFISLFGILDNLSYIVYLGIFVIVLNFAASFYVNNVDRHLELKNDVKKIRCYPGEDGDITLTFAQRGILPILGGQLIIVYDRNIALNEDGHQNFVGTETYKMPFSLLSFEEKSVTIPFKALHRGVARIRAVKLEFQHILGFGDISLTYEPLYKTEVIVYPSLRQVDYLNIMKPNKNGDHFSKHSIFEQPILPIGTRDYAQGDPFNRIHWKATAREGKLQTKIVEQVNQLSWLIIMNMKAEMKDEYERIEEYLKYAAYISKYATELNIPFEIYINIPARHAIPFYHLPLSSGKDHYIQALETLARFEKYGLTMNYSRMLKFIERRQMPLYIIHMGDYEQEDLATFHRWSNNGHLIYKVEDGTHPHIQPLPLMEGGKEYEIIG